MANYNKKPHLKRFQKGQSGNPQGSSALARELGEIRKLNQVKVVEILNRFVHMPLEDIVKFAQDKTNPGFDIMIASVFIHGIKSGDHSRATFLMDRLIGRVKEQIEFTAIGNVNKAIVDKITEIEKANSQQGEQNGKSRQMYGEKSTEKIGIQEISSEEVVSTKEKIGSEEPE